VVCSLVLLCVDVLHYAAETTLNTSPLTCRSAHCPLVDLPLSVAHMNFEKQVFDMICGWLCLNWLLL
jgi:hypothetical protein